jgi:hypothetical protein
MVQLNKEKKSKSVLVDIKTAKSYNFNSEQNEYFGALKTRLTEIRDKRNETHEEFDGLDYVSYYVANERGANTTLKAIKNKGETQFQSGTLRTKMMSLLSTLVNLNLSAQIRAFNRMNILINSLGESMEDIEQKQNEVNKDQELKMLRQYEMLKQGTVFIETMWEEEKSIDKELKKGSLGMFNNVEWESKSYVCDARPVRRIISGLSVYLGNMRQYFIEKQPDLFTCEVIDYSKAKELYGDWEMFEYVSTNIKTFNGDLGSPWKLFDEGETKNKVEVIKYQNVPANEFQIILNGIPMLPVGFPIPWGQFYSIDQQNLEPIREDFAYGKSFIFKNKNLVSILDEMMKLAVLKTQKSFMPPYINTSGRNISRNVLMPATISTGFRKGDLLPVSDNEAMGVTSSEFAMIQELTTFIDRNTVSQTFAGGVESGSRTTATQIMETQRQAKVMLGLLILTASLLEEKLSTKTLLLNLQYWFEPDGTQLNEARNVIENRYRIVSQERSVKGEGKGIRMTIPTDKLPNEQDVYELEGLMKKKIGKPVKIIMIDPKALKSVEYIWNVIVTAKEEESSELSKLMLEDMIAKANAMGIVLDKKYVGELFAEAYDLDPEKLLGQEEVQLPEMEESAGQGVMPDVSNIKPQTQNTLKV